MSIASSKTNSLAQYLEQLQGTTLRRLYQQPSAAFAIFRRMLPHLAKTIVMACLYMPTPFLLSDLEIWVRPTAKREKDQAISILKSLHIVAISIPAKDAPQTLSLTPNFRTSLRLALEGGGRHNSFGVPSTQPVPAEIDAAFLDRYAHKKWDDILHFVVNSVGLGGSSTISSSSASGPKQSVKDLLVGGRLVERRNVGSGINITQAGFTFLLQETNAQVWTLLLLWLEAADHAANGGDKTGSAAAVDSVDMLSFFFLLASLELGRAYSTDALTERRQNMLPNLVDFGLIYIPPSNPHQFFPTRLATTLTSSETALRSVSAGFSAATTGLPSSSSPSSSSGEAADGSGSGGVSGGPGGAGVLGDAQDRNSIILETNFRMYAYVQSPLQIAVLALFSELKFRFRGLVSGHLTRASIRRAIDMGITSDQIVSYLATHAHEQMRRQAAAARKPLLPPVVVDQIRLWQLDSERMAATPGWLFRNYDSQQEYLDMANFADDIGVVVWRNDRRRMFFAHRIDQIKDYMKVRGKAREQQQQQK
ncbi:RNA polymerase II transcription factor B 52 kDa subunit [Diatrype stigma]|uniref:RNA polymerase II transcription factor B subunit 2 n=1 Tax=Diatrype stigma TaxID=117547 RepID=A0AAN9USR3_9PEZI